jgi:positive regulator of sigma E activity
MKTLGRVVRRAGSTAWVSVCHDETCSGCGMHSPGDHHQVFEADNRLGAEVGQRVEVGAGTGAMVGAMLLVFWLPLLAAGMMAWVGLAASATLGWTGWPVATVLGALGFAGAAVFVHRIDKRTGAGSSLTVIEVVGEPDETAPGAPPAGRGMAAGEGQGEQRP